MVKDGYWYGLGFLVVAGAVCFVPGGAWLSIIPVLLAAFFLWFFRDPTRDIPQGTGLIVSPADGVITQAEVVKTAEGSRLRISVFLNVFNVHVNRSPVAGTVTAVEYRKGGFMNAMNPESVVANEQTMIVVEGDGYTVAFKQIAGLLARRIVCNVKQGDRVQRGERIGMIKFGSRCDILLPAGTDLKVKVGMKVKGGSTVLGSLAGTDSDVSGRA